MKNVHNRCSYGGKLPNNGYPGTGHEICVVPLLRATRPLSMPARPCTPLRPETEASPIIHATQFCDRRAFCEGAAYRILGASNGSESSDFKRKPSSSVRRCKNTQTTQFCDRRGFPLHGLQGCVRSAHETPWGQTDRRAFQAWESLALPPPHKTIL